MLRRSVGGGYSRKDTGESNTALKVTFYSFDFSSMLISYILKKLN